MIEDIPAEVREEPLKPLERSTEVEESPIPTLGVVSKTDGRIVPEETMMVQVSSRVDVGSALRSAEGSSLEAEPVLADTFVL